MLFMIVTGYFKKVCDNWEMRKKQNQNPDNWKQVNCNYSKLKVIVLILAIECGFGFLFFFNPSSIYTYFHKDFTCIYDYLSNNQH